MIILLNMSFLNYILIEGDVLINTQYTVTWPFEVPISISNKLSPIHYPFLLALPSKLEQFLFGI